MDASWRIELLGWLRAMRDDQVVSRFRSQKAGALLAYLAYYRHRSHPRETLIELLWPGCDPEAGRRNLRVELTSLRHQLEPPGATPGTVIVADRATVQLSPACVTDVAQFDAALRAAGTATDRGERARLLAQAVELYHGPLLPGYYEEWIIPEKQRLEEFFFQALRQLIAHFEQVGELDCALQYAHRAVSADPLREEAHHELIRLYAATGQHQAAQRQFSELERQLDQALGATPSLATRTLARAIGDRQTEADDLRAVPHPLHYPDVLPRQLEAVGGAVALDSPFYIARSTDTQFAAAMARQDSIVLVKGTRQVGKSSLLARALQQARQSGARVVLTDLQMFNAVHLESSEALLLALAQTMADQLQLHVAPTDVWDARRGPNPNFRRYVEREVLSVAEPLVWGLDQVDRLFHCDFGSEVFGLFRSWHNERALDPGAPWSRLTLSMAYSTEAHLFITDVDQSPFNVGTRLTLDDFTPEQTAELNRRHGSPLNAAEASRLHGLVHGHPYLVRRGLHEIVTHGLDIVTFEARAGADHWIFGDHLRRILVLLTRDPELCEVIRALLQGRPCPTADSFYRLWSAGVVTGDSEEEARLRCPLYAGYLRRHLL